MMYAQLLLAACSLGDSRPYPWPHPKPSTECFPAIPLGKLLTPRKSASKLGRTEGLWVDTDAPSYRR